MNKDLNIDPVFDAQQKWIWISDWKCVSRIGKVYVDVGYCDYQEVGFHYCVRAVRSLQSDDRRGE